MLGYTKVGNGEYVINEEEAEIVRRIYREYLAGITVTQICRGLEDDAILTKLGKKHWHSNVIISILGNEKYTGNAILGKTFKPDVLSKYRQKNKGQAPMYYAEGTHPAIIDKEMYEMAKKEMKRRRDDRNNAIGSSRYTSKYPFSGLLICGVCGHRLRRHVRTAGSGAKVPAWGCANRIENSRNVCNSHHINEDQLQRTYLAAIREMIDSAEEIVSAVRESAGLIMEPDNRNALNKVEQQIIDVQEAVLTLHKAKQLHSVSATDYVTQIQEYSQRMKELEAQQTHLRSTQDRYTEVKVWLDAFAEHIKSGDIINTDDGLIIKTFVEHIIVNKDSIEIRFKCGVVMEKELA